MLYNRASSVVNILEKTDSALYFLCNQALCQNPLDGYSLEGSPRKVCWFSGESLRGMVRTFLRIVCIFWSRRRRRTKMIEMGLFIYVNYFVLLRWHGEPSYSASYGSFVNICAFHSENSAIWANFQSCQRLLISIKVVKHCRLKGPFISVE